MFQTNVVEIIKTHILRSATFFFQNRAVYDIRWKNVSGSPPNISFSTAEQATDDNMAHAHYKPDT
jgi:hypothetical protein